MIPLRVKKGYQPAIAIAPSALLPPVNTIARNGLPPSASDVHRKITETKGKEEEERSNMQKSIRNLSLSLALAGLCWLGRRHKLHQIQVKPVLRTTPQPAMRN